MKCAGIQWLQLLDKSDACAHLLETRIQVCIKFASAPACMQVTCASATLGCWRCSQTALGCHYQMRQSHPEPQQTLQNLPAVEPQQQIRHPPCLVLLLQRGWAVLPGLQILQNQLQGKSTPCRSAPKGTSWLSGCGHVAVTLPGCVAAAPKPLLPNGLGEPSDAGPPNPGVAGAPNPGVVGAPNPAGHRAQVWRRPHGNAQHYTRKESQLLPGVEDCPNPAPRGEGCPKPAPLCPKLLVCPKAPSWPKPLLNPPDELPGVGEAGDVAG